MDLPPRSRSRAPLLLALAALLATTSCWTTRRWPEPMGGLEVAEDEGPSRRGGPLEVTVVRHSDPVQIRRPGAASAYPLRFFSKQERVPSGTTVLCGAGGRAELLWTETGTNVLLHGNGAATIGEPTRGEVAVRILGVESARVHLLPSDRVELPGGAVLRTLGTALTGPVSLMRVASDVLRVENRTKDRLVVRFREAELELNSGEVVDLPPLSSGGVPRPIDPDLLSVGTGTLPVLARGAYDHAAGPGGVRLVGRGATEVRAQGVRLVLAPGDEAVFTRLVGAEAAPALQPPEPGAPEGAPDPVPSP